MVFPMKTVYELIHALEVRSPIVATLNLVAEVADATIAGDLFNFGQDLPLINGFADSLEMLSQKNNARADDIKKLTKGLVSERHFYGSFCEIGTYRWLQERDVDFQAQVPRSSSEVLNKNMSELDGNFTTTDIDFDIKAFGVEPYIAKQFLKKVQGEVGQQVEMDGPIDIGAKEIELTVFRELKRVVQELKASGISRIAPLNWILRLATGNISTSIQENDPYRFAEKNRVYALKGASQFAQTRPFVLIFALSARFNPGLAVNFDKSTEVALRALARRTFLEFRDDTDPVTKYDDRAQNVTVAHAAALVSALLFVDLDLAENARLFINPFAAQKFSRSHAMQIFDFDISKSISLIDDFAHDCY